MRTKGMEIREEYLLFIFYHLSWWCWRVIYLGQLDSKKIKYTTDKSKTIIRFIFIDLNVMGRWK